MEEVKQPVLCDVGVKKNYEQVWIYLRKGNIMIVLGNLVTFI